eukprot:5391744-Amphidinium_carterae.1
MFAFKHFNEELASRTSDHDRLLTFDASMDASATDCGAAHRLAQLSAPSNPLNNSSLHAQTLP